MTETTTQPDPAREWAEAWLEDYPECRLADLAEAVGTVYGDEVGHRAACAAWFADDPESNPYKPVAAADIPAGQGAASLYVDGESTAVMYRTAEGHSVPVPAMWVPTDDDGKEALNAALAALAAALPAIDSTEESK